MKLTDIEHEKDGRVNVRFGKPGIEFNSIEQLKAWVEAVLSREDVRRAIVLRRALEATSGTLKPVSACRGFRCNVDFASNAPVTIVKDAS